MPNNPEKVSGSRNILILFAALLISHLAGVFGSLFTVQAIPTWYAALEKPFFTPPSWMFAPVWLTLYTLMGIAAFLVWRKKPKTQKPYVIFGIQLFLNALWSLLFFGMRSPLLGLIEIIALWMAVAMTIMAFYKISRQAGLLLLPYIVWVSIAAALNFGVWVLNP